MSDLSRFFPSLAGSPAPAPAPAPAQADVFSQFVNNAAPLDAAAAPPPPPATGSPFSFHGHRQGSAPQVHPQ